MKSSRDGLEITLMSAGSGVRDAGDLSIDHSGVSVRFAFARDAVRWPWRHACAAEAAESLVVADMAPADLADTGSIRRFWCAACGVSRACDGLGSCGVCGGRSHSPMTLPDLVSWASMGGDALAVEELALEASGAGLVVWRFMGVGLIREEIAGFASARSDATGIDRDLRDAAIAWLNPSTSPAGSTRRASAVAGMAAAGVFPVPTAAGHIVALCALADSPLLPE